MIDYSHIEELSPAVVPIPLRVAFAILICSVPFESVQTPYTTGSYSIAKYIGWIFLLVAAAYPGISFRRAPWMVWMFVAYLVIYTITGLYQDQSVMPAITERALTLLQMIVFLWIAQNLLADPATALFVFVSLGISTVIMSLLQLSGITNVPVDMMHTRVSALGEDPNSFAAVMSIGFLSLLGVAYFSSYTSTVLRIAMLAPLGVLLLTIVQTGSRGGILALCCAILVFALDRHGKHPVIRNTAIVGIAVAALTAITLANPGTWRRFEQVFYAGTFAQREKIVPVAIDMIREKPILGWGPHRNVVELGIRTNARTRDTHNVFLLVLTEVGIVGGLPYFLGLAGCGLMAFRARSLLKNSVPLALFVFLMVVNSGITWHTRKLHWYVLAYCIASFSSLAMDAKEKSPAELKHYVVD